MSLSVITRHKLRRWLGAMGVSLGTALFAGAISILVDRLTRGGRLNWLYLAGLTIGGLILSAGGAWLVTTVTSAVGVSVAAMDHRGDTERYQDETDSFARFGQTVFTAQTTVGVYVEEAADLPLLRAALRTLAQIERNAREIGLLFQGRPEVGFHLGQWLNQASSRIDLYTDARGGGPATHFTAIRLTPAIQSSPRTLDIAVHALAHGGAVHPRRVQLAELATLLHRHAGECICLAVNLNGQVGEAGFVNPVLDSARQEGAAATVFVALPAPPDDLDAPGRQLAPTSAEYESATAAIVAVARHIPAKPGLLYLKTPAVIPVALGRYLYGGNWTPMRYLARTYEQFRDSDGR